MPDDKSSTEAGSRSPEWLFVMRHARAQPFDSGLHPEGESEARDVGGTLARVLEELSRVGDGKQALTVARFLYEPTKAAKATARAVAKAHDSMAANLQQEHGRRRPALPASTPLCRREVPGLERDAGVWLQRTRNDLLAKADNPSKDTIPVVLLIGHEPGMSWLIQDLLSDRHFPTLARSELLALHREIANGKWKAVWALTPNAKKDIEALTAKIRSKMDTAKAFGAFVTALLTFVATQYADNPEAPDLWPALRGLSLAALGVAVLLYFMTLFFYDRLLMPTRFWSTSPPRGNAGDEASILRRPPSSAAWVLYQNMQRIWRRLFVPATVSLGVGLGSFAFARIQPDGELMGVMIAALLVIAIAGWYGWKSQPVLGVQD